MNMLEEAFSGRRVLVTGDTGFKGSWLCLWLNELGAKVCGLALPPDGDEAHYSLLKLESLIRHVDGDVRDLRQVQAVFEEFKPEVLFHLAAQAIVRVSYRDPKLTFDTNIGGSVNILEAVRASSSLRSVVYVTSDKCYRNDERELGYKEDDTLGGRDPYSASKAAAELVYSSYWNSFLASKPGLGVASVRAGNVIGGGDWAQDRIIPDCMRHLQKNRVVPIRNPASTRPWQHVLEPLNGYLTLAVKLLEDPKQFSGSYNLGPVENSIKTVEDLVAKTVSEWGSGSYQACEAPGGPHEAGLLHLNCEKADRVLGWRPLWGFDRTVTETVRWYRDVWGGQPALSVSRKQINNYMQEKYD